MPIIFVRLILAPMPPPKKKKKEKRKNRLELKTTMYHFLFSLLGFKYFILTLMVVMQDPSFTQVRELC